MFEQDYLKARIKGALHSDDVLADLKALDGSVKVKTFLETLESNLAQAMLFCDSTVDDEILDDIYDRHYDIFDKRNSTICCLSMSNGYGDRLVSVDI